MRAAAPLVPAALCTLTILALVSGCSDPGVDPISASDAGAADAHTDGGAVGRPAGWTEKTHGKKADPDWALLFDDSKVQRIDITIAATDHALMLEDMAKLYGAFGAGKGGGPGGGGGGPPAALVAPCKGKQIGDACAATLGGQAFESTCAKDPLGAPVVLCVPPGGGAGGPPGGGAGGPPGGGGGAPPGDLAGTGTPDPIYVPATVRHNGGTWTWVGLRFKGNSSLKSTWAQGRSKLPFRLHFDRYEDAHPEIADQRFYGFKKMTFASNWSDDSLIREKLGAEIMRAGGVAAARGAFCRVFVDVGAGPVYWGLYTMVEDPSDKMDEDQLGVSGGNFYKPEGKGADWTAFAQDAFVKKSNDDEADWSDVKAAIAALHADRSDAAAWRAGLEAAFDVEGFLRFLAINTAMVSWDTYGAIAHNYYLYGDPADNGRLTWIPWDFNMSLSMQKGAAKAIASVMHDEVTDKWPLIRYLLDDAVYRATYVKELQAALDGPLAVDKLHARMEQAHALIAPFVVGEQGEKDPYTLLISPAAFEASLTTGNDALKPHIVARHQAVAEALAAQ